jgi:hypothetical protein
MPDLSEAIKYKSFLSTQPVYIWAPVMVIIHKIDCTGYQSNGNPITSNPTINIDYYLGGLLKLVFHQGK